ncbi:PREDICTED: UDP-N-acetylglucosamine transferase subunit ALG14 homolog isoform X2 [Tarenaya hassleriana]|uniref:UDP-N-acetylglucosamine transferase subunit ALG14 homolog isoform X2 n=1 Tax=Tarenaya hassleriana TaxID=28532 RepID=UPI00053C0BCD|nr:PREDICTED: UDP-N-acetylglucosamine transferase subunit ALG14 homolog isoform X2 [Tarenaya hassleriana]
MLSEEDSCCFSSNMASIVVSLGSIVMSLAIVLMVRIVYVIYQCGKPFRRGASKSFSTLIVLGSGGHTAEMLSLLSVLQKDRFKPRFYITAATDNMSLQKARAFEDSVAEKEGSPQFMQIYRSREVGQSYVTSVWTTLVAMVHALWLMIGIRPRVVLCNGPGTCIPLCVIAFLFKVFGIRWSSIFYVESVARVKKLSLSGLILYKLRVADQFFVQWPQLQKKYPRAHYVGCLM